MTAIMPPRDEVVVADERLRQRRDEVDADRERRRTRRLRRVLTTSAGLVGAALTVWLVAISPAFAVRQIEVMGAGDMDAAALRDAGGLRIGQAVWSVDSEQVAARIRRRPEVLAASVTVRWPDSVEVRVRQRPAIARVVADDGEAFTVALGGLVLQTGVGESATLMTVSIPSVGSVRAGDRLPRTVARAIDVAGRLPVPVLLRVEQASIDDQGEVHLASRIGADIRFGLPEDIDAKMRAIEAVLSGQVDLESVCSLDVRNPSSAVLRRRPDCDPPPAPPPVPAPGPTAPAAGDAGGPPPPTAPPGPAVGPSALGPFGDPGAAEPEVVVPDPPPAAAPAA